MAKKKFFGFKTPVRRSTKNVSGHKVVGDLTGGEVKIVKSNSFTFDKSYELTFPDVINHTIELFQSPVVVLAIGGYFHASADCEIVLSIECGGEHSSSTYLLEANKWYALGNDLELDNSSPIIGNKVNYTISFRDSDQNKISYTGFNYGMVDYQYFIDNDVYQHYSNSKKRICFPEQFYFSDEKVFRNESEGEPIYKKSCNRCQRFIPINPLNERMQLGFTNHCSSKPPCTHSNFGNYTIKENILSSRELKTLLDSTTYSIDSRFLYSYYGHQLECKACKKFFVNSALNHLRTSTQHREDALRRRAIEILTNQLLHNTWIYHKYRIVHKKEFDKEIWKNFDKKCFKCGKELKSAKHMHLDHTMPLASLYPLDETATCLCGDCNNAKRDQFPVNYYNETELIELAKITGIDLGLLKSTEANIKIVRLLKQNVIWFIETFLQHPDYQKVRDGKKSADAILHSVQKAINNSKKPFDILKEYRKQKGD